MFKPLRPTAPGTPAIPIHIKKKYVLITVV